MKKVIVCSGGGIRACAFTLGALRVIGVDNVKMVYGKSGSAWAVYLAAKLGVRGAVDWVLRNMDSKSKVYKLSLWNLIRGKAVFTYDRLESKLARFDESPSFFPFMLVTRHADENRDYYGYDSKYAIASSSIDGLFPRVHGSLVDLGSEGLPKISYAMDDMVIFINAYNDSFPRGKSILDRLGDSIERPLAQMGQRYAEELDTALGNNFRHVEITERGVGINDFSRDAILKCLKNGAHVASAVMNVTD